MQVGRRPCSNSKATLKPASLSLHSQLASHKLQPQVSREQLTHLSTWLCVLRLDTQVQCYTWRIAVRARALLPFPNNMLSLIGCLSCSHTSLYSAHRAKHSQTLSILQFLAHCATQYHTDQRLGVYSSIHYSVYTGVFRI